MKSRFCPHDCLYHDWEFIVTRAVPQVRDHLVMFKILCLNYSALRKVSIGSYHACRDGFHRKIFVRRIYEGGQFMIKHRSSQLTLIASYLSGVNWQSITYGLCRQIRLDQWLWLAWILYISAKFYENNSRPGIVFIRGLLPTYHLWTSFTSFTGQLSRDISVRTVRT